MSAHKDPQPDRPPSICYQFPLRARYVAQIVLPPDLSDAEAVRLCAFVWALSQPKETP